MTICADIGEFFASSNAIGLDQFTKEYIVKRLSETRLLYIAFHPEYVNTLMTEAFQEYVFLYGTNCVPIIFDWSKVQLGEVVIPL